VTAPPQLRPLLDRIHARLPADRARLAASLAVAAFRLAPARRMEALDLDETAGMLDEALAFVERRSPGTVGLRVDHDGAGGTIIQVHLDDMPFLLATLRSELEQLRLEPVDVVHPVFGVRRDSEGVLLQILPARGADHVEAYQRLKLPIRLEADECDEVARRLLRVLDDVRRATRDYEPMRDQLEEVLYEARASAGSRYGPDDIDEVVDLLNWLRQDRFIMLGFRGPGVALGILDDTHDQDDPDATDRLLVVGRTRRVSTVYRRVPMVRVTVNRVEDGELTGRYELVGLYAQKALAEPASTIPVLRRKLQHVIERQDLVLHSSDERALRILFDSFPKHELFELGPDEIGRTLVELLDTSRRREPRLLLRNEPARRSVSVLFAVPRERYSDALLMAVQRLLDRTLDGQSGGYRLRTADEGLALLHFRVEGVSAPVWDDADLQRQVAALARTFLDDVEDALTRRHGRREARLLLERWGSCLPAGYTDRTDVETALTDLAELERLPPGGVAMRLHRGRFRLYHAGPPVEPSRVLPLLESLGLAVAEEVPHRLRDTPLGEVTIHEYAVPGHAGDDDRIARAALAMWTGTAEVDSLNRLVTQAGLEWDDVAVLRAYRRYRQQLGSAYSESYTNDALVEHPDVARALLDRFAARLAPSGGDEAGTAERLDQALRGVERLDQDRILRGFANLVDATLRTNRWRPGRQALALKLDSRAVDGMPKPVPFVEVSVHSPDVEGVHLRGGPVARGGVRWSDRLEDFRTEVLGLLKAQMTKNAVIVPAGSKGGFVLKGRCGVREGYETFIRALLDVTDNVVDGQVVHPAGVRARDGEDAYLVVAADRGTATFSDVANAISAEYGYWLGDAFASGGSSGYDHKAMGITAGGAWVAVQRHFRELGIDVQHEPITVVGVGDMSGDVFGNAMLQSDAIKLVAAFDHRDLFLDPDPDPGTAAAERRRLFELPRSSWQDYDREAISRGGGVWRRTAKLVPLSEPVRRVLGVDDEALAPPELIRALLGARVDLLFFGGIGTFVKATAETAADVGDRGNDEVRVDATAVRARVIGEGANLAITQRGRIEYALKGGRCNTDSVDNSAGVGTSDREVNLKILLGDAPDRDQLLRAMQDDVGRAAKRDVYLQTWAISQELGPSARDLDAYERLMADLGQTGRLDRKVEALPPTEEIERRRAAGAGLARPEIAVLLGHAKVDLAARLLDSPLPDLPLLQSTLRDYFPRLAVERFGDEIGRHRLRRELVATAVANDVVNRLGVTWVSRTSHELGCRDDEAAAAYWAARSVADADALYRRVEALDERIDPQLQVELESQVDHLVDGFARTYIRHGDAGDLAGTVARDRPAFTELEKVLGVGGRRSPGQVLARRYDDLGLEPDIAERIAILAELHLVPDVAAVARASGQPVPHVCEVFGRLAAALPLDLLRRRLGQVRPEGRWAQWQHRGLLDELGTVARVAAATAIAEQPGAVPEQTVGSFLSARAAQRSRLASLLSQLGPEPSLDAIAVAVRALHDVL
jgi:glutamate dehydrogenase